MGRRAHPAGLLFMSCLWQLNTNVVVNVRLVNCKTARKILHVLRYSTGRLLLTTKFRSTFVIEPCRCSQENAVHCNCIEHAQGPI
jgi:hypothetical protein